MPIQNYTKPQLQIFNNIEVVDNTLADRFRALIVGPQYRLNRYGQDTIPAGVLFAAAGQTLHPHYVDATGATQVLPATDVIDAVSLAVYITAGELSLAAFAGSATDGAVEFHVPSLATPQILKLANGTVSGAGLAVSFYGRNTQVGDVVYTTFGGKTIRRTVVGISSSTNSTTSFDQVILNGPAVDLATFTDITADLTNVEFRLTYTGALDPSLYAYNASNDNVVVQASTTVTVSSRATGHTAVALVDGLGILHLSFRSLIPPAPGEDVIPVETINDLALFGPNDLSNDLGYGVNAAFAGSQGRGILALRVASLNAAGFISALQKVESNDSAYAIALLTTDITVIQAGKAHALAMSQPNVKNWRKIYCATDSPGSYPVLKFQPDGVTTFLCNISGGTTARLITALDSDVDFTVFGLVEGDIFISNGVSYTISQVVSPSELILEGATQPATGMGVAYQVWKADTVPSQVAFLQQRAEALGSELVVHIWQEKGTAYLNDPAVPVVIPSRFIACEIAGLRSAMLPQQGLTHTEIALVTAIPNMYLRYRQSDLDAIASAGNFIITQETAGGAVFIRHQLTTNTSKGSLFYEDNVTMIAHDIDFATKDVLEKYIGKRNATNRTASQIQNELVESVLRPRTVVVNDDIGPELVAYAVPTVIVDPTLTDRIKVTGNNTVPTPLNAIDVTWNFVTGAGATTTTTA